MVVDAISEMRAQKAASNKDFSSFVFWRLGDKERMLIRPLVNLNGSLKVRFHHFWDDANKTYIDAVCAGANCVYCKRRSQVESKRVQAGMEAKEVFMLPVYLLAIQKKRTDESGMEILDDNNNPIWEEKTYTDRETNETKRVSGFRMFYFAFTRSATSDVADKFLEKFEKGLDISTCNWIIERQGGDKNTKYVPSVKNPSPFKAQVEGGPFTHERILEIVLSAAPMYSDDTAAPAASTAQQSTGAKKVEEYNAPEF